MVNQLDLIKNMLEIFTENEKLQLIYVYEIVFIFQSKSSL